METHDIYRMPLFPRVTPETHARVQDLCTAQGCTHSEVVEGALLAYLTPTAPSDRDVLLFQRLGQLETAMEALVPVLEKMLMQVAALVEPPKPAVASYAALYATGETQIHDDKNE